MLATAKSPNKEDMWGVFLKPFSPTRRASKHFSVRWKASARASRHVSSFLAKLTSTISRWGVYVKDFCLPLSVSFTLLLLFLTPTPRTQTHKPNPPPRLSHPLPIRLSLILPFASHFTILFLCPPRYFQSLHQTSPSPFPPKLRLIRRLHLDGVCIHGWSR